jgi:undecaprenyl-diphosphatase
MDYSLYKTINGLSGSSFPDDLFKAVTNDLSGVLVVIVGLVFLIPWRTRRAERRAGAVLATAAGGLGLLLNQPIAHAVNRTRPYVAHPAHSHLLISSSHDPSFPSDHATGAFALAVGVWLYDRIAGTLLLILASILAFSRVYVGTHYPGDVVGGALIGVTVALALYLLPPARRLLEAVATRAGKLWDGALDRVRDQLPGSRPRRRNRARSRSQPAEANPRAEAKSSSAPVRIRT